MKQPTYRFKQELAQKPTINALYESCRALNLSANAIEVYEILLKKGALSAVELISFVNLSRTNLYHVLNQLKDVGLVESESLSKRGRFVATNPEEISVLLQKHKSLFENSLTNFNSFLPNLLKEFGVSRGHVGVYRFEGLEGLKRVYTELLKDKETVNSVVNRDSLRDFIGDFNDFYIKERIRKRIRSRVLYPSTQRSFESDEKGFRESRSIPKKLFPYNMDLKITSKKIILTTFNQDSASGIIIIDGEMSKQMLVLFELLWSLFDVK